MKEEINPCWMRINRVIKESGLSVNAFALSIGLSRGENLYQIKRGHNGISLGLAKRIHAKYPSVSIGWLMWGEFAPPDLFQEDAPIVRIPVYGVASKRFPFADKPDYNLILTAAMANGAEWATPYADDILNPYLRDSVMLLRKHSDEILWGNIYLIVTEHYSLFRILHPVKNYTAALCLRTLCPDVFIDTIIHRESVISLWLVVGAISKLCR